MKFETIKNILEDNVEVFKKSDGNYGIEGVNNNAVTKTSVGGRFAKETGTKITDAVTPTVKSTSIAVMKYLKSVGKIKLLDPNDTSSPDIVPMSNGDVKVNFDSGTSMVVKYNQYKPFLK
jgi:hypothetical protein